MNFSVLPPEITSAQIFAGAGSGPMLAAANAWDGLAAELDSAAESFGSVITGLTGTSWQGAASTAMAAAATPYAAWLSTASATAAVAAGQANAVAAVFEAVRAATRASGTGDGQSVPAGVVGAVEHLRFQRARDRGGRGVVRTDVGPGCDRDVGLSRRGVCGGRAVGGVGPEPMQGFRTWASEPRQLQHRQRQHRQLQLRRRQQRPRRHHGGSSNFGVGNYGSFNIGAGNGKRHLESPACAHGESLLQRGGGQHRPVQSRIWQRGHRQRRVRQREPGHRRAGIPSLVQCGPRTTRQPTTSGIGNVGTNNFGLGNSAATTSVSGSPVTTRSASVGSTPTTLVGTSASATTAASTSASATPAISNFGLGQHRQRQHRHRADR